MDPDQVLAELREFIHSLQPVRDGDPTINTGDVGDELIEIMEKFEALDEWLTKGGFPPADWRHGVPARG